MIAHIDQQLTYWARWMVADRVRLGYPRQSAFVAAISGARGRFVGLSDEQAWPICEAVRTLPPPLREVVECYYCHMPRSSAGEIARHLNCCRQTVYARLDRAHLSLLSDLGGGSHSVVPQAEQQAKKRP